MLCSLETRINLGQVSVPPSLGLWDWAVATFNGCWNPRCTIPLSGLASSELYPFSSGVAKRTLYRVA